MRCANRSHVPDILRTKSQLYIEFDCGLLNTVKFVPAGPPAVVEVDMVVRSMGPISEVDMVSSTPKQPFRHVTRTQC